MKAKAIIVGGSIAGISCAHALISAGWDVVVLEKTAARPKGHPTGAGLGLEPLALGFIGSWLKQPELLQDVTIPITVDQNLAISEGKVGRVLTRDDKNFDFRTAHWSDLHGLLCDGLQPEIFLWGHMYISFCIPEDNRASVKVKAKVLQTGDIVEIIGDLLVAADGGHSSIRQCFYPDLKLRYSGYCAWRGVLDYSGKENSETILGIRKAYPELGKCLYFSLTTGTHIVLFEAPKKRINWVWHTHQPQPEINGNSVTIKPSRDMIKDMLQEAEKIWIPELVRVMEDTEEPFINAIYDLEPLEQVVWDRVVLVGDAAHATSPHCVRSTNMSVVDAVVLGRCLEKWGPEGLTSALAEFQSVRLPVTSKQVLHSRRVGRIKQGMAVPGREQPFDPRTASPEECEELRQIHLPFFDSVPLSL